MELGLPLAVGEPITRGQGEYTSTYPPVVCGHPREMTADYVESLLAPPELLEQAARDWSAVLSWARAYAGLDRMQDTPAPAADLSPPAESVAEDDAYGGWEKLK